MEFRYSDGGRGSTIIGFVERNDCTVRALALAAKIPYEKAHIILSNAGRLGGRGFAINSWLRSAPWLEGLFFKVEFTPWKPIQQAGRYMRSAATYTT